MEEGEQEDLKFKISQNFLAAVSRAFKSNPRRMILLCLLAAAGVHNLWAVFNSLTFSVSSEDDDDDGGTTFVL